MKNKRILQTLAVLSYISITSTNVYALPDQGNYDNSANAIINVSDLDKVINITGINENNIINWKTFSVAANEVVKIHDNKNYLNVVCGTDISRIFGTISGGNNVYLINPYGILLGSGATLDNVGKFIASTRDLSDVNYANFLKDPNDVNGVLFSNEHTSKDKDYRPDDSPFKPVISVAEINLTNVPDSATQIILDSPNGILLKNVDLLDKVSEVRTEKTTGEIGIGTNESYPVLTEENKNKLKIFTTNGIDSTLSPIVTKYNLINTPDELQSISDGRDFIGYGRYMLNNDIKFNTDSEKKYSPFAFRGTLEGFGYKISNISLDNDGGIKRYGIFSEAEGTFRNLTLENYFYGSNISPYYYNMRPAAGGLIGLFSGGSIVNVNNSGTVNSDMCAGGIVGQAYSDTNVIDIRQSTNKANVSVSCGYYAGGIVGNADDKTYMFLVGNEGDIYSSNNLLDLGYSYGIGGIAGISGNNNVILSAYNKGNVRNGLYVGGIVGMNLGKIGDAYSMGEVYTSSGKYSQYLGPIVGAKTGQFLFTNSKGKDIYVPDDMVYVSKVTGKPVNSYHSHFSPPLAFNPLADGYIPFGTYLSSSEDVNLLFKRDWASMYRDYKHINSLTNELIDEYVLRDKIDKEKYAEYQKVKMLNDKMTGYYQDYYWSHLPWDVQMELAKEALDEIGKSIKDIPRDIKESIETSWQNYLKEKDIKKYYSSEINSEINKWKSGNVENNTVTSNIIGLENIPEDIKADVAKDLNDAAWQGILKNIINSNSDLTNKDIVNFFDQTPDDITNDKYIISFDSSVGAAGSGGFFSAIVTTDTQSYKVNLFKGNLSNNIQSVAKKWSKQACQEVINELISDPLKSLVGVAIKSKLDSETLKQLEVHEETVEELGKYVNLEKLDEFATSGTEEIIKNVMPNVGNLLDDLKALPLDTLLMLMK